MKIQILFFFIFSVQFFYSQDGENPLPFVHQEPKFDTAAQFPGGSKIMMNYFENNVHYPEPEKTKMLQGNVSVKFNVTKEGKLTNIKVLNGVAGAPNLAKEAVRLLQKMPLWIPASKKGKPIESEYFLSIPFKIKNKKQ